MKKPYLIIVLIALLSQRISAQAPWRAQFIGVFQNPDFSLVRDTIWVGCDSLATDSFDISFDELDSMHSNQITLQVGNLNLKKSIMQFDTSFVINFVIRFKGKLVDVEWRFEEFKYFNNSLVINYSALSGPPGSSIGNWDNSHSPLVMYETNKGYICNCDETIETQNTRILEISPNSQLNLSVLFSDSLHFNSVNEFSQSEHITISQVNNEFLFLQHLKPSDLFTISISDIAGKEIYKHLIENQSEYYIPISNYLNGSYLIRVVNKNNKLTIRKFIKY